MLNCREEAVVAMDKASIQVQACRFHGCKGPGMDISNQAHLEMTDCFLHDNIGMRGCLSAASLAAHGNEQGS